MPVVLRILLACLTMTLVTVVLGVYALRGEQELGSTALRIYDGAFMSVNFARSAQAKFERARGLYVEHNATRAADEARRPAAAGELSERQRLLVVARGAPASGAATVPVAAPDQASAKAAIGDVLDDLDVAIQRSMSDPTRRAA